jgi:hypothetical protein
VWPETPGQVFAASKDVPPPPITQLLMKKPWLIPLLYTGRIPRAEELETADPHQHA